MTASKSTSAVLSRKSGVTESCGVEDGFGQHFGGRVSHQDLLSMAQLISQGIGDFQGVAKAESGFGLYTPRLDHTRSK